MKCLFISDAHYPKNETIINFLLERYNDFDKIFILGDLFEFYYGYGNFFYSHHLKLLNLLNIISKKRDVFLFEGNHEYRLETIREFLDVSIIKKSLSIKIDSFSVYLEHGDTIDKKDFLYTIFRNTLKNRLTLSIIDKMAPSYLYFMSRKASEFSKKRLNAKKYRGTHKALEMFAKDKIKNGFDVVIFGHTHNPLIKHVGKGLYINSGDFFKNFSYVVFESGKGFSLKFFDGGESG